MNSDGVGTDYRETRDTETYSIRHDDDRQQLSVSQPVHARNTKDEDRRQNAQHRESDDNHLVALRHLVHAPHRGLIPIVSGSDGAYESIESVQLEPTEEIIEAVPQKEDVDARDTHILAHAEQQNGKITGTA